MKTYKINNVEVSAEEIRKIVKENPDLLKKETKGAPFVPNLGDVYWVKLPSDMNDSGYVGYYFYGKYSDIKIFKHTEVYGTEEEAKQAVEIDRAILRVRCWIRDNVDGGVWDKPDWSVGGYKYFIRLNHEDMLFETDLCMRRQVVSPIGYFRTVFDAEACIFHCRQNLKIIFGVEDK